jgi:iron complex transport system permease protein
MSPRRLELLLLLILVAAAIVAVGLGESAAERGAISPGPDRPGLAAGRGAVGHPAAAGADGRPGRRGPGPGGRDDAGLLRNPLAEPGVLGVSATAGLGASLAIAGGLAAFPGAIELAALAGALAAGAVVVGLAARFREPEVLILFGVALSAFAGALTALVFNLSPSPVAIAEVLAWLMGSVENRDLTDILRALAPMVVGPGSASTRPRGCGC